MIKLPAYLTGFSSRTDGSAGIRFTTQELSADEFSKLKEDLNKFGWLLFSEGQITKEDIPDEELVEEWEKTPSQRLRAVLYLLWKKDNKGLSHDDFYKKQMEKIINLFKQKLE